MQVLFDDKEFMKGMKGLVEYTIGFLDGVESSKMGILENLGKEVVELLKNYIDSNARINPAALHHIYEWNMTGSPSARLFDIEYVATSGGLRFSSQFSQSKSIANGSTTPFYDKARIMEDGIPVVIRPKRAKKLAFEGDNGEMVFTSKPVVIANPGGEETTGSFERVIDEFFNSYFTQAYLNTSEIFNHLKRPSDYSNYLSRGIRMGKGYGKQIGYNWATKGGTII